jgi:hypothetical protein
MMHGVVPFYACLRIICCNLCAVLFCCCIIDGGAISPIECTG